MSPDAFDHLAQLLQTVYKKNTFQKTNKLSTTNLYEGKVISYTSSSGVR